MLNTCWTAAWQQSECTALHSTDMWVKHAAGAAAKELLSQVTMVPLAAVNLMGFGLISCSAGPSEVLNIPSYKYCSSTGHSGSHQLQMLSR